MTGRPSLLMASELYSPTLPALSTAVRLKPRLLSAPACSDDKAYGTYSNGKRGVIAGSPDTWTSRKRGVLVNRPVASGVTDPRATLISPWLTDTFCVSVHSWFPTVAASKMRNVVL